MFSSICHNVSCFPEKLHLLIFRAVVEEERETCLCIRKEQEQIDALQTLSMIYWKFIQTFSIIYWIVTTTTAPLLLPIGSPLMLVKSRYFGFFSSLALRAAISSNLIASRTLHSWVLIFTLLFRSLSCRKVQEIECNF